MAESNIQLDLGVIANLMRDISRIQDPQELVKTYRSQAGVLIAVDRTVSISRRDLAAPLYRITRSDLWEREIDPWKERDKLPVLQGGLLGKLLYIGEARIIDELQIAADDPAKEHFAGMGSLAAIPHFDNGAAINMVIHMRRGAQAFDRSRFPDLVLLSGLFGRAMHGLVARRELQHAQEGLQAQYHAVSELSDTILEQARALKAHAASLEGRVRERTEELEAAHQDAIYMLAAASEAKDDATGEHVRRMQHLSYRLARQLGENERAASLLGQAAILHDVGKMQVPDSILKKPAPLTDEEREIMKGHTIAGENILSERAYFAQARRIARGHHENWDGSGYPDGLSGSAIPFESRIVHLADVYDALTHARPYKAAWQQGEALAYIRSQSGKMFDPGMVEAFAGLEKTALIHHIHE